MAFTLQCTVSTRVATSPAVAAVAGMFGLGLDDQRPITLVPPTNFDPKPGEITFLTGPSGGGKSTLLRLIADALRPHADRYHLIDLDQLPPLPDRPLVDCFGDAPLPEVLALLSRAGLNDAFVMLRRPAELSDGQRNRLRLAQALHVAGLVAAGQLVVVLADEFTATLDRTTAKVIARNVRKWVSRAGLCFVAATTHDDLLESLDPDHLFVKELGRQLHHHQRPPTRPRATANVADRLVLARGTMADYHALSEHHYRAAAPVTATRVLVFRDPSPTVTSRFLQQPATPAPAAVLVESYPALACRMRDFALPGRYQAPLSRSARARLLNQEIRCISRVVVHPQYRGLGLAGRLVRAALAEPTTRYTEALAAMGAVHPFFARAGMTAYPRPPHERDARLLAALERVRLPPERLCEERLHALDEADRDFIRAELARWARPREVDVIAAVHKRLRFTPVYFLFDCDFPNPGGLKPASPLRSE